MPAINMLDDITTVKQTYLATYHIIVKVDDPAVKPDDIKEYNIGVEKSHDFDAMKKALDGLAAEFNHTLNVIAYDNLLRGKVSNLVKALTNPNFKFIKGDLLDKDTLFKIFKTK